MGNKPHSQARPSLLSVIAATEALFVVVPQCNGAVDWREIADTARERYAALLKAGTDATRGEESAIIDAQAHVAAIGCIALGQLHFAGLSDDGALGACLNQVGHLQAIAEGRE